MNDYDQQVAYINNLYKENLKILDEIEQSITINDLPIHIGAYDGLFLKFLIKLLKPKKVIEIGTHHGYSTILIAHSLCKDAKIYTIEHDKVRFSQANINFISYGSDKIVSIMGKAEEELKKLIGKFDMIFIDANKRGYNNYLDWAENNIVKGGIIIADDVFLSGAVYTKDLPKKVKNSSKLLMQKFNERLSDNTKYQSVTFANGSGLTAAIKLF